jgi:hypothetical protein
MEDLRFRGIDPWTRVFSEIGCAADKLHNKEDIDLN